VELGDGVTTTSTGCGDAGAVDSMMPISQSPGLIPGVAAALVLHDGTDFFQRHIASAEVYRKKIEAVGDVIGKTGTSLMFWVAALGAELKVV